MKHVYDSQITVLMTVLEGQKKKGLKIIKDSEMYDMDKDIVSAAYETGFDSALELVKTFLEALR